MFQKIYDEILSFFPDSLSEIKRLENKNIWDTAEEIRIRSGQTIMIKYLNNEIFLNRQITTEDMLRLLESFCNNSIYAVQNEINSGYITLRGGHRIGVSGTGIIEDGKIKNIKYISSLNIRVAREVKNCSKRALEIITNGTNFENTLIVSPPRSGKNNDIKRYDTKFK